MPHILVLLLFLCVPSLALAQAERKHPEIKKIQVGFKTYVPNLRADEQTVYKVGLWNPVHIEISAGTDGIRTVGRESPFLDLETEDSEGVGTSIKLSIPDLKPNEAHTALGYIKPGHRGGSEFKVTLRANGRTYEPKIYEPYSSLEIDASLYLTLGNKITALQRAVHTMDRPAPAKENDDELRFDPSGFRQVALEDKVERLPEAWFGYNGVDLIVLTTANDKFLKDLNNSPKRLGALAQWVRRGGRLVVPVAPASQPIVADLMRSKVWDPAIPVAPPRAGQGLALRSVNVAVWGQVQDHPFQRAEPKTQRIEIATLDPGRVPPGDWTILALHEGGADAERVPLIAQVRYGLGQITYFAFSFEDNHFFQWAGKEKFLQTLVQKLGPRAAFGQPGRIAPMARFDDRGEASDLATEMLLLLDNFDVKVIPFGYVALFIVLYILVVGPLDFVLLKYVFKRLEWTWITFPAVVLAVSVIAYFAAYALKGRDLKINKIDIVDFDLRTDVRSPRAYGHSFFTVLSPRIQNYTLGVEPNSEFWGAKADRVRSVDLMSWMGRPSGGPHGMGRNSSGGFFKKPYTFREDAGALEGVPIPVWTTKAFTASWELPLKSPPFRANLSYHVGKDVKVSGTLENHLAVDLVEAWLLYEDYYYPIHGGLKSVKGGGNAAEVALEKRENISDFASIRFAGDVPAEQRVWSSDPLNLVKRISFHERIDTQNSVRNHLLRPLDLGWRTYRAEEVPGERRTREAILFGRVRHVTGPAEQVTGDAQMPPATKLWLGDTPDGVKSRPSLIGHLNQDTYVRVILPVRHAE